MNTSLSKIGKVVAAGAVIGTISIAGVAYNSNKQAILEQINQLKTKANQWQKQAGDNKYELQQQQEKYNSIIAQLKDKLGLDIADGATAEEIATALQNYVDSTSSKTDVDTYNTAISSIANSLGLELTDADKDEKGMYDYNLITGELSKLDDAITELNKLITDEEIDTTGNTEGSNADDASLVAKINYLINQIKKANDDQTDILKVATEANNSVEASNADFIKLNYALAEGSVEDTYGILNVFNEANLYGPVTTPIDIVITNDRTQEVHIADPVAYEYTTKHAQEVEEPDKNGFGIYKRKSDGAYFVVFKGQYTFNSQYKIVNR